MAVLWARLKLYKFIVLLKMLNPYLLGGKTPEFSRFNSSKTYFNVVIN